MQLHESVDGTPLRNPKEIAEFVQDLESCAQEQFVVLTFDVKSRLIARHMVALGTLNSTLVHPREVFRPAILDSAAQIIVVHNHPSGDPSPSAQDLQITKKLIDASRIMDIPLVDHIIMGRKNFPYSAGYLSLRESGLCEFEKR